MKVIFTCPECGHKSPEFELTSDMIANGLIQCGRGYVGCREVTRIKELFYNGCFKLNKKPRGGWNQ